MTDPVASDLLRRSILRSRGDTGPSSRSDRAARRRERHRSGGAAAVATRSIDLELDFESESTEIDDAWILQGFPNARIGAAVNAKDLAANLSSGRQESESSHVVIRHPLDSAAYSRLIGDELFFDLETLGFHGRPLFLIGALRHSEWAGWEVVQFLARDYSEEEAVLLDFLELARERPVWVSFNGKSFDLPFMRNRAAYFGVEIPLPEEHLDLLHSSRRHYRGLIPNCKLQTLESYLFGRHRVRDLPGREIPEAYHDFVRSGDPEEMIRILEHNRDDLTSLADLHLHLLDD